MADASAAILSVLTAVGLRAAGIAWPIAIGGGVLAGGILSGKYAQLLLVAVAAFAAWWWFAPDLTATIDTPGGEWTARIDEPSSNVRVLHCRIDEEEQARVRLVNLGGSEANAVVHVRLEAGPNELHRDIAALRLPPAEAVDRSFRPRIDGVTGCTAELGDVRRAEPS